jgi:plasmid stabilization system protein ParE
MAMRGRVVPEIGDKQIRELIVKSYRLIYRVERSRVSVLTLVHSARDLKTLWRGRAR